MTTAGTAELASLEGSIDLLRISQARDVSVALAELLTTNLLQDRIALLADWMLDFPNAASQLLCVVAGIPETAVELATTVIGCRVLDDDHVDSVLAAALPKLTGPLRDAAADRAGVREILGLPEGVGYTAVPHPEASWLWPTKKPFPAVDTVAGVQARLNYLDLGAGPVTGEWTQQTRTAFTRWQLLYGLAPTGELDEESMEYLAFKTPDAPD